MANLVSLSVLLQQSACGHPVVVRQGSEQIRCPGHVDMAALWTLI